MNTIIAIFLVLVGSFTLIVGALLNISQGNMLSAFLYSFIGILEIRAGYFYLTEKPRV